MHDVTYSGIHSSNTTWVPPGTNIGYADQQNGAFIAGTFPQPADQLTTRQSGCPQFEATRDTRHQVPAAVEVAACTRITSADTTSRDPGQVGLGLGNDADANGSGTGLGVTDTTVHHHLFTDLAGGVQPDAHHPSDARMTRRQTTHAEQAVRRHIETGWWRRRLATTRRRPAADTRDTDRQVCPRVRSAALPLRGVTWA